MQGFRLVRNQLSRIVESIKAFFSQQNDISVGYIVGLNSFNISIIFGLTAMVCPVPVQFQIIKIDAPLALGVALLPPIFLLDHILSRVEGLVFVVGIVT